MEKSFPFVVAVVSEKGGVGKTTIATNLAVYLKGLREDLPVAIASFDNHFSVDNMFAIGRHKGRSVSSLFDGVPAAQLMQMGEYGVEFMASDRLLEPAGDDLTHLRRALSGSGLSGILVLDTRPILDYFTKSALLAADLVLVPVKDRASLVNVASICKTMEAIGGDTDRMWLIPSLIDRRLRLRGNLPIDRFLAASAAERGYQVVDTYIAKSPKVEGLATNLASRIYPVLTHARSTLVHSQFRTLASFVLNAFEGADRLVSQAGLAAAGDNAGSLIGRLSPECPVCAAGVEGGGHFFQDLRTRRRGFVHGPCLDGLIENGGLESFLAGDGILAVEMGLDDFVGGEAGVTLHLFDRSGRKLGDEQVFFEPGTDWPAFLDKAAGRSVEELFRDVLLVTLDPGPVSRYASRQGYGEFSRLRRKVLREVFAPEG